MDPQNVHELSIFQKLACFFGYMYIMTTANSEMMAHLLFTFHFLGFNATQKMIRTLVGPTGNNGKTELMSAIVSMFLGDSADSATFSVLRENGDGGSHDAKLASIVDNYMVLIADEAGRQPGKKELSRWVLTDSD